MRARNGFTLVEVMLSLTVMLVVMGAAVKFFRVIGNYTRSLGGDLKLTLSPAWGRDTVTFSGAQAESTGPFTSVSLVNHSLSYRMRVHGRITGRLALDSGLDMLSRVTSYEALLPVDDQLINPQGDRKSVV